MIYILVRNTTVTNSEDNTFIETEVVSAYTNKQDANFERKYLNSNRTSDEQWFIEYDIITTELYT